MGDTFHGITEREHALADELDGHLVAATDHPDTLDEAQARSRAIIAAAFCSYRQTLTDERMRYAKWVRGGDTGTSSKTLLGAIIDAPLCEPSAPSDGGDLGRCIRFLREFPELREQLDKVRSAHRDWPALIDNWEELEALYEAEIAEYREHRDGYSKWRHERGLDPFPVYNRMRELRGEAPMPYRAPVAKKRKRGR